MFSLPSTRLSRAAALTPYAACAVLVVLLLPLGGRPHGEEFAAALVLQAVVACGLLIGDRLMGRAWIGHGAVLLYLASVALLRDASGPMSGYGALALLPVIWAATTGRRRELVLAVAGTAAVFAVPIVVVGAPRYPDTGWRAGGLATVLGATLGYAVLRLITRLQAQSRDLSSVLNAMAEGVAVTHAGRIVAVNPALCELTGFTEPALLGAGLPFPFWPPELGDEIEAVRRQVVASRGGATEVTLMRADGTRFPAAVSTASLDLDGRSGAFLNTIRDVTEERRHIDRLAALAAVTRAVSHSDPLDARHTICEVALEICGIAHAAVIWEPRADGALVSTSMEPASGETFVVDATGDHGARQVLRTGEPVFIADAAGSPQCDQRLVRQHGIASLHFQPIAGGSGVRGVLAISFPQPIPALPDDLASLITVLADEAGLAIERADLLARLDELTRTDELTGLPNRRAWDELLDRQLETARRTGAPLSVAMLDLDHFKNYNDRHGHLAGDRVLQRSAHGWQERLRLTDVLARWGGEEFALMLTDCDAAAAAELVGRLRDEVVDGVTFSAGLAEWDGRSSARELVDDADRALYRAKTNGRNRTELAAPRHLTR